MDYRLKAVFFLTLVNCLWGMSFPTVKVLNAQLDRHFDSLAAIDSHSFRVACATWIIGSRFLIALVLLGFFFRKLVANTRREEWIAGAIIGFLFLIGLILQTIGLATIPASRSGFLTSLSVVFTPLIVALSHGERPAKRVLGGVVVALAGVAVLTGLILWDDRGIRLADDATKLWTIGDTLTTVASIFFSFQIFLIDRFGRKMNSAAFTPGMFAVVAIVALSIFAMITSQSDEQPAALFLQIGQTKTFWPFVLILSIFPSLLAFSWMNTYQPHLTAVQAAIIYTLEPVFVSTWALFLPAWLSAYCQLTYPNESMTFPMIFGGGLILIANLLALFPSPSREEKG